MVQGKQDQIRRLTMDDVDSAMRLSLEAGWNQTANDWRALIELAPDSCLAADVNGELAATTTLLCYGRRLAWIGMVLTKVEFRGQGLANRLLAEALRIADKKNVETIKLDATDEGRPLYEKSGFRPEQTVERWFRRGEANSFAPAVTGWLPSQSYADDQESFGADRSQLLENLSQRSASAKAEHSWLLVRPGSKAAYLGPCVAHDAREAHTLIEQYVQSTESPIFWDLLVRNRDAVTIAKDLGFTPQRQLTRMVRKRGLQGKEQSIYALAGFEFG